jgi:hypothetical protein
MRAAWGPILVCAVLVATLGVVHGVYTDRWGASGQLQEALAVLPRVPSKCGDWTGEDVPHDPEELKTAGIQGGVFRRYTNPKTGEAVSFLVVCGRGGPISVHTPDICYAGAGYRQLAEERQKEVDCGGQPKETFKIARFVKAGGVVPTHLEIYWSWSRDGSTWQAPVNPRLHLARAPALFKLYVVREFVPKGRGENADTTERFLKSAVPAIRQALAPAGT